MFLAKLNEDTMEPSLVRLGDDEEKHPGLDGLMSDVCVFFVFFGGWGVLGGGLLGQWLSE